MTNDNGTDVSVNNETMSNEENSEIVEIECGPHGRPPVRLEQ